VKTKDLIVRLATSAKPVTPLATPVVRALRWSVVAAAVAALCVVLVGPRADIVLALGRGTYLTSLTALLIACFGGALAAFVLSVPGAERSPWQRAVPVIVAIVWPLVWLNVLLRSGSSGGRIFHVACALEITAIALVSGIFLVTMLRRAAPLRVVWTSVIAALASVTIGGAATQIMCPIDDPVHQLLGHVLIAAIVGLAGVLVTRSSIRS
jgi:hypothetical protein